MRLQNQANTIDEMLERLDKSFQKEKQFTSDASHELRTPVTVILAESEYILKHWGGYGRGKRVYEDYKIVKLKRYLDLLINSYFSAEQIEEI